jgi:hypothetical protein
VGESSTAAVPGSEGCFPVVRIAYAVLTGDHIGDGDGLTILFVRVRISSPCARGLRGTTIVTSIIKFSRLFKQDAYQLLPLEILR